MDRSFMTNLMSARELIEMFFLPSSFLTGGAYLSAKKPFPWVFTTKSQAHFQKLWHEGLQQDKGIRAHAQRVSHVDIMQTPSHSMPQGSDWTLGNTPLGSSGMSVLFQPCRILHIIAVIGIPECHSSLYKY